MRPSSLISHTPQNSRFTVHDFPSVGCVEVAVSIIVCNMSVIIPAVLRALGVGDPFMQEDTVEPGLSTGVDIARMSSARVELSLPTSRGTAITDSDESEGGIGIVAPLQRITADFCAKGDRKHKLTTQALDASLGNSKPTFVPLADEPKVTDSLVRVRSFPVVKKDQGMEVDIEKSSKRNSA